MAMVLAKMAAGAALSLLLPAPAGAEWILVFRQSTSPALWQDPAKWSAVGTSDSDENYSVLGNLEALRSSKTEYKLKLVYPKVGQYLPIVTPVRGPLKLEPIYR
jgi:hypothetical protein